MYSKGIDEFNSDYGVIKDLLKQLIICDIGSLELFEAVILTEVGIIQHYNYEIMKKVISMNSQFPSCTAIRSQIKLQDRKLANRVTGDSYSYSQYFDTAIKTWFASCMPHESLLYGFLQLNNKESLITFPKVLFFYQFFLLKFYFTNIFILLTFRN